MQQQQQQPQSCYAGYTRILYNNHKHTNFYVRLTTRLISKFVLLHIFNSKNNLLLPLLLAFPFLPDPQFWSFLCWLSLSAIVYVYLSLTFCPSSVNGNLGLKDTVQQLICLYVVLIH